MDKYGLWLNIPRIHAQRANDIGNGVRIANGKVDAATRAMAEALARFPEEVEEILFQLESARNISRVIR